MATTLITQNVWKEITKAARKNGNKSCVAVAYFRDAKMLPLKSGSRLVIDASDNIIKSGQTDPRELIKLYKKGVQIYHCANLHAKVYVIGTKLFLGSANVSHNSAGQLLEAVLATSERKSVQSAKEYIIGLCKVELGVEQLKQLSKIYQSPKFHGGAHPKKKIDSLNRVNIRIVKLAEMDYPEGHNSALKKGKSEAAKKRINKSRHYTEEFNWAGEAIFKRRDMVIQIVDNGKDEMVLPPSTVIHTKAYVASNDQKYSFVFVETLDKKNISLKRVKKVLSPKDKKAMDRNGVKSPSLSAKLISLWN